WEKELLGIYLSEHPMGEVASQVGAFVTAYSGDLKDESLDGQRIVVAGRIDHRGEEVSLLADLAVDWDEALARGPEAFAHQVAAGDRGRAPRRSPASGGREFGGNGNGNGYGRPAAPVASRSTDPTASPIDAAGRQIEPSSAAGQGGAHPEIPYVSPLRADARPSSASGGDTPLPSIAPGEPIPTYSEPGGFEGLDRDRDVEPALPDEARDRAAGEAAAVTPPLDPSPGAILHVRFAGGAGTDRVVGAMEAFRGLLVERPGATRVVLHVPAPSGGSSLPMELRRGVAYDAELLAEVRRRLGEGLVELSLS
ncbi:MAG TPA: hypothetical protein VK697_12270, partial [Methylomirabilota bacterium]|nr:hypothetical protein [Methylomirabilota bacterium]